MILASSCSCLCQIHLSQVFSREWRCSWSSADRRCFNYIWVIINFNADQGASYIRGLAVHWYKKSDSLGREKSGRHFLDDILNLILVNENVWIPIEVSLKFVPKGPNNNIAALVQIMAWRRQGAKPLSEPMMVWLSTHICVIRPQWDNR